MARMEPFLATNFKCNWCEMSWVACDKLAIGLRWFKLGYQQAALSFTYYLNGMYNKIPTILAVFDTARKQRTTCSTKYRTCNISRHKKKLQRRNKLLSLSHHIIYNTYILSMFHYMCRTWIFLPMYISNNLDILRFSK